MSETALGLIGPTTFGSVSRTSQVPSATSNTRREPAGTSRPTPVNALLRLDEKGMPSGTPVPPTLQVRFRVHSSLGLRAEVQEAVLSGRPLQPRPGRPMTAVAMTASTARAASRRRVNVVSSQLSA